MRDSRSIEQAASGLSRRLSEWRRRYQAPTPLPDEIWDEAVEVAIRHGVYQTSRALGLNYANLKKRVAVAQGTMASTPALPPGPTVVELLAPLPTLIGECSLELTSRQGARVRVEMRNVPVSGLASILREFAG